MEIRIIRSAVKPLDRVNFEAVLEDAEEYGISFGFGFGTAAADELTCLHFGASGFVEQGEVAVKAGVFSMADRDDAAEFGHLQDFDDLAIENSIYRRRRRRRDQYPRVVRSGAIDRVDHFAKRFDNGSLRGPG